MTTTEIVGTVAAGMRRLTKTHAAEVKTLKAQHEKQIKHERNLHAAAVKSLVSEWEQEVAALNAKLLTASRKAARLTRQRDEAKGNAANYRDYANKYQRELIQLKKGARNA